MWRGGLNKFGVAPRHERTLDGVVFDSKREMEVYSEFKVLKRCGEILDLELQPRVLLIPKPNKIEYIPDFRVVWKNGNEEWIDVKGMETPEFKLKAKMFRHFYPTRKLVIMK